jgi:hypothetical protein
MADVLDALLLLVAIVASLLLQLFCVLRFLI